MKVVYEKTITQQILEKIVDAEERGIKIEKFVLTKEEYKKLQDEFTEGYGASQNHPITVLNGFKVEVEDKE